MSSRMNSGCDEVDGSKKFEKKQPSNRTNNSCIRSRKCVHFSLRRQKLINSVKA